MKKQFQPHEAAGQSDCRQIERRLDTVRSMCHHSHKRLIACFQGQHGTDAERRHKKLPLTALAQNMQEASAQLEESLLGKMLETCGVAENQLALELSQHEVFVEKEIMDPLYGIAEVEIPNIQKQRKQLARLVLDWDSVREHSRSRGSKSRSSSRSHRGSSSPRKRSYSSSSSSPERDRKRSRSRPSSPAVRKKRRTRSRSPERHHRSSSGSTHSGSRSSSKKK